MARACEICGKGKASGYRVSHANNRTKRTFMPNLQKIRIALPNGSNRKALVCTRCIRSGRVRKPAEKLSAPLPAD